MDPSFRIKNNLKSISPIHGCERVGPSSLFWGFRVPGLVDMTMFSSDNSRLVCGGGFGVMSPLQLGYIGGGSDLAITNNNSNNSNSSSPLIMDDSGGRAESSSKDERDDQEWLQLSIGTKNVVNDPKHNNNNNNDKKRELELDLELMGRSSDNMITTSTHEARIFRAPRPVLLPTSGGARRQETINWGLIRPPVPISIAASSSGSPAAGGFRVIPPPRRPHSGLWFMLLASQTPREKEQVLVLPQISKSYLRIKDGKMTIRLVIKYLANKLRLENESEIEISCRGQRLAPSLTLQHVRDEIWSNNNQRDFVTLLPNSSTTHHIMVLHYAKISSN